MYKYMLLLVTLVVVGGFTWGIHAGAGNPAVAKPQVLDSIVVGKTSAHDVEKLLGEPTERRMLGGIRTYTYAYHAPWAVATTKLVVCYDNNLRVVAVIPSTSVDMPFTR